MALKRLLIIISLSCFCASFANAADEGAGAPRLPRYSSFFQPIEEDDENLAQQTQNEQVRISPVPPNRSLSATQFPGFQSPTHQMFHSRTSPLDSGLARAESAIRLLNAEMQKTAEAKAANEADDEEENDEDEDENDDNDEPIVRFDFSQLGGS